MMDYARVLEGHLIEQMAADEIARQERMREAWKAYFGEMPKPLKVRQGEPDDNVIVAKARVIVDTAVSFLIGSGPSFQVGDESEGPEDEYLAATLEANGEASLWAKLAMNGALGGHPFARIVAPAPPFKPYPRVIVLDPATVRVVTADDDIDTVYEYIITWSQRTTDGRAVSRRQTITRQMDGRWLIVDMEMDEGRLNARWVETGRQVWGYPWPPIVDCQNLPVPNRYYGEADLTQDVVALIKSANFTLSNWARIIKWHANPKTYATGVNTTQPLDVAADRTIILPQGATLNTLQVTGDLAGTAEFHRRLEEAIYELTATPPIATGKVESVGQLSGTALKVLYGPLMAKTEKKRRLYGAMLEEIARRILDLGGYGYDQDVTVSWPEVLPIDALQETQTLQLQLQMGVVSKKTASEKLGYDWQTEEALMSEQQDADAALGDRMLAAFERGQSVARQQPPTPQDGSNGNEQAAPDATA